MAVVLGSTQHLPEQVRFSSQPAVWLWRKLYALFTSSRHNPSPFPDRIWSRHSALLDSAWRQSHRHKG